MKKYTDEQLDKMSNEELHGVATEAGLEGRSTMSKDQLNAALKKHFAGDGETKAGEAKTADKPNGLTAEDKGKIAELQKQIDALQKQIDDIKGGEHPELKPAEKQKKLEKTDPTKSANENLEAGGFPTGTTPGGTI